jgi:hypothetical protein
MGAIGMTNTLFRHSALAAAIGLGLSGCAAPAGGATSASHVFSMENIGAVIMTGRNLTAHAVSMITGKDCHYLETLLRNGGSFCEAPKSIAAGDDARGASARTASAANLDPYVLGFAPVDRRAAEDFSLEIARKHPARAEMLSFGMLSATFGSSYTYELKLRGSSGGSQKLAQASPAPQVRSPLQPARGDYSGL